MVEELSDDELAVFFEATAAEPATEVSPDLMARVLADAGEIGAGFIVPIAPAVNTQSWIKQFFSPIGGIGGAFALGAFASIGLIVGLGDSEVLYDLPVMGDILATFSEEDSAGSPYETLDFLMSES